MIDTVNRNSGSNKNRHGYKYMVITFPFYNTHESKTKLKQHSNLKINMDRVTILNSPIFLILHKWNMA